MNIADHPVKDSQTVTSEGERLIDKIDGVKIRKLVVQEDPRGELIEVFNQSWNFHPDPLVFVYTVCARPGSVRGWQLHKKQDDRIFSCQGVLHWVLFDNRPESPTYKLLNQFTFGMRNPVLMTIPKGVYHAVKNIGAADACFINMPTQPYNHQDPDKYRLPMKNDLIPFHF